MSLITFLIVSFAVIVIPGPNVMVIVATSMRHGPIQGLQTVAGTSLAMLIQLAIAATATGILVSVMVQGLTWLKWAGVAYLVYLGITHVLGRQNVKRGESSALVVFSRGFWISLTNPKTILFFSAFLPQFVSPDDSYAIQIAILSMSFWLLAVLLDSAYALLAASLAKRSQLVRNSRAAGRLQGLIYLGAGAALAASREG